MMALLCLAGASLRAHTVEQFYASYEEGSGVILLNFDVAYAMPDVREVPQAPQPLRSWLVERSDAEHADLRKEAEQYLRGYLEFLSQNENMPFEVRFPDFKADPYAFPQLLNEGAYYNMELVPILTDAVRESDVELKIQAGKFPKLIVVRKKDGVESLSEISPNVSVRLTGFLAHEKQVGETLFSTWDLFVLGFQHVIPDGLDHILFIVGMCLIAASVKQLLWQSLIFTLTHSLSMALVVSQVFPVYSYGISSYVEAIIALSIAFIALESILMKTKFQWRCLAIATLGFVHGLGFAGSLGSSLQFISLDDWLKPLILANVGIEAAQALLVVVCFFILFYIRNQWSVKSAQTCQLICASLISAVALFWFFERLP